MKQGSLPSSIFNQISDSQHFLRELQADSIGYEKLATFLKENTGINMPANEKNRCLMAGRLAPTLQCRNARSYLEYYKLLTSGNPEVLQEFVEQLTTNTTEFFRESKHFEIFRMVLTELIASKQAKLEREIRIWCAATSTGQEPYSILMTALESIPDPGRWTIRFLATDIDTEVLQRAAAGIYSNAEVQNVPPIFRQKYLMPCLAGKAEKQMVQPAYREMIRFAQFNLNTPNFPFRYPFDFVFCRNVLIYFDRDTAADVIEKIARTIRPGGTLFLGHSETGLSRTSLLKSQPFATYRRVAP